MGTMKTRRWGEALFRGRDTIEVSKFFEAISNIRVGS
jgi:hypothetical protein